MRTTLILFSIALLPVLGCAEEQNIESSMPASPGIDSDTSNATIPAENIPQSGPAQGDIPADYRLLGVRLGETFQAATSILQPNSTNVTTEPPSDPVPVYESHFQNSDYTVSIFSIANPRPPRAQNIVREILIEANSLDHGRESIRTLYDTYKRQLSDELGSATPEELNLGVVQIHRMTWSGSKITAELEYQEDNGVPSYTKVKLSFN